MFFANTAVTDSILQWQTPNTAFADFKLFQRIVSALCVGGLHRFSDAAASDNSESQRHNQPFNFPDHQKSKSSSPIFVSWVISVIGQNDESSFCAVDWANWSALLWSITHSGHFNRDFIHSNARCIPTLQTLAIETFWLKSDSVQQKKWQHLFVNQASTATVTVWLLHTEILCVKNAPMFVWIAKALPERYPNSSARYFSPTAFHFLLEQALEL